MLKRSIFTISPVLIGLLTGCATQQTWVPELENAQNVYSQISQDPIVASLAAEDLNSAARQLQRAEDSAASFKKPDTIAHQATLAKLKTLTAQQRARALTAKHDMQVALGQTPLLSSEQIAAATYVPQLPALIASEPVMAAANTSTDTAVQAELAALRQQLAALQAMLSQQQMQATMPQPSSVQYVGTLTESLENANTLVTDKQMLDSGVVENSVIEMAASAPMPATVQPMAPLVELPAKSTPAVAPMNYEDGRSAQRKLRAMNAKANTRGMSLMLGERYFDNGSDRLMRQRAARHLDNVASVLNQNPSLQLFIEGHTDNKASAEESQNLSVNRAISIKSALVLRGVEAERISTRGFGHTRPVAENETAIGRLQNRRVELIFPVSAQG